MKSNIALIGFMGTGKTMAGMLLAKELGKSFVETDELIEKRSGKPIKRIFSEDGEFSFRRLERDVIKEVSSSKGLVISCGGGAVLDEANVDNLRKSSFVILLTAAPGAILDRTSRGDARPMLTDPDRLGNIKRLLATRMRAYTSAADFSIDTTRSRVNEVVDEIIGRVKG